MSLTKGGTEGRTDHRLMDAWKTMFCLLFDKVTICHLLDKYLEQINNFSNTKEVLVPYDQDFRCFLLRITSWVSESVGRY